MQYRVRKIGTGAVIAAPANRIGAKFEREEITDSKEITVSAGDIVYRLREGSLIL